MRSYRDRQRRYAIVSTLDRLTLNPSHMWRGSLQTLFAEVQKRTGQEPSDHMMRAVLLKCGKRICPGDYQVTQKKFSEVYTCLIT